MVRRRFPGELEQVVLITLAGFEHEASGRQVYESIVSTTGRDVAVAAVHITLTRLAEKGWAECRTFEPRPHEGGKPRRRYALSADGAQVLTEQRDHLERLWGRAVGHPLLGEGGRNG